MNFKNKILLEKIKRLEFTNKVSKWIKQNKQGLINKNRGELKGFYNHIAIEMRGEYGSGFVNYDFEDFLNDIQEKIKCQ